MGWLNTKQNIHILTKPMSRCRPQIRKKKTFEATAMHGLCWYVSYMCSCFLPSIFLPSFNDNGWQRCCLCSSKVSRKWHEAVWPDHATRRFEIAWETHKYGSGASCNSSNEMGHGFHGKIPKKEILNYQIVFHRYSIHIPLIFIVSPAMS